MNEIKIEEFKEWTKEEFKEWETTELVYFDLSYFLSLDYCKGIPSIFHDSLESLDDFIIENHKENKWNEDEEVSTHIYTEYFKIVEDLFFKEFNKRLNTLTNLEIIEMYNNELLRMKEFLPAINGDKFSRVQFAISSLSENEVRKFYKGKTRKDIHPEIKYNFICFGRLSLKELNKMMNKAEIMKNLIKIKDIEGFIIQCTKDYEIERPVTLYRSEYYPIEIAKEFFSKNHFESLIIETIDYLVENKTIIMDENEDYFVNIKEVGDLSKNANYTDYLYLKND